MPTPPIAHALDVGIETALHILRRAPALEPLTRTLADHRRDVAASLVARYRPVMAELEGPVLAHDPEAISRYDALAAEALGVMRRSRPRGARRFAAALDRALYRNGEEYLDDPAFPEDERLHVLAMIDRLNTHLGSYEKWCSLLEPLLRVAEAKGHPQARVVDLAAGHGGFAIALKEQLGPRAALTATDLKAEYLEVGRREARARGVDVAFAVQDATSLSNLRGADVDVFLCTQSLHHFPPGMVARMLGEAARCARAGACFIDGERGLLPLAVIAPLMLAWGRSWPVLHDTVVSLRRMPCEEELLLLGSLAPGLPAGARVESGRQAPGYAWVRVAVG